MTPARKTIATFGPKGRSVRVLVAGDLARVQWRENDTLRTKSWANTPAGRTEAKAWARAFAEHRDTPLAVTPRVSVRALWDQYRKSSDYTQLRARSQQLYSDGWRTWERFVGCDAIADDARAEDVDRLRRQMEVAGLAIATVRQVVGVVKLVYKWGERREIITRNRLRLYVFKVAKESREDRPAEYRQEEFVRLLAAFAPHTAEQWRPFVALTICGVQGARQNAVLHLRVDDVDLEHARIHWRREWDKRGKEWSQPLRRDSLKAVRIALDWRARNGYAGPWLIPSGSSKNTGATYTAQSLWAALRRAEERAGITHQRKRAAHGLRRMLAGDVAALTGNAALGLRSIGDTDMRMAEHYLKDRDDATADAFARLDAASDDTLAHPNTNRRNDEQP